MVNEGHFLLRLAGGPVGALRRNAGGSRGARFLLRLTFYSTFGVRSRKRRLSSDLLGEGCAAHRCSLASGAFKGLPWQAQVPHEERIRVNVRGTNCYLGLYFFFYHKR